jgi:hypothetical protein
MMEINDGEKKLKISTNLGPSYNGKKEKDIICI